MMHSRSKSGVDLGPTFLLPIWARNLRLTISTYAPLTGPPGVDYAGRFATQSQLHVKSCWIRRLRFRRLGTMCAYGVAWLHRLGSRKLRRGLFTDRAQASEIYATNPYRACACCS